MHFAAAQKGLQLIGFSEHSPRPLKYNYKHEYRDQLTHSFPSYISEVKALKSLPEGPKTLLGLEMDWFDEEIDFIRSSIAAWDYDYIIGSVHFLGTWGFDDGRELWLNSSQEECEKRYKKYFQSWLRMLQSGLFQIAAHPDLIKIFSIERFHTWVQKKEAQELIEECLIALRDSGMAMEISSAGLRKPCQEIYPCSQIMTIAARLNVPISIASDAHCIADIGNDFEKLENYARSFGFHEQTVFDHGKMYSLQF